MKLVWKISSYAKYDDNRTTSFEANGKVGIYKLLQSSGKDWRTKKYHWYFSPFLPDDVMTKLMREKGFLIVFKTAKKAKKSAQLFENKFIDTK